MSLSHWFQRILTPKSRRPARRGRSSAGRPPGLERLEDRLTPSATDALGTTVPLPVADPPVAVLNALPDMTSGSSDSTTACTDPGDNSSPQPIPPPSGVVPNP